MSGKMKKNDTSSLELHFDRLDQVDATAPVRWCINRPMADLLKRERAQRVWVLISIVHEESGEMDRYLSPLDRTMEYLQFHKPGKHTLYATVVYTKDGSAKNALSIRQYLLSRYGSRGKFRTTLVKDEWVDNLCVRTWDPYDIAIMRGLYYCGEFSADVVVSEDLFAPEPPEWLENWASLVWDSPNDDQCDFRKRVIFSFTVQPIVLAMAGLFIAVAWTVASVVKSLWALIGMACGVRLGPSDYHVSWKGVFSSFKTPIGEVWDCGFAACPPTCDLNKDSNHGGSWLFYRKDGRARRFARFWALFTPMIWIVLVVIFAYFLAIAADLPFVEAVKIALLLAGKGIAGLLVLALTSGLVFFLVDLIAPSILRRFEKTESERAAEKARRERERREAAERRRLQEMMQGIDPLLCGGEIKPDLAALPPERRTLYLRFQDLKARVCRPFAIR